jgi:hypothetical protein
MKIHNKGSSKGKDWSFFGKALLWSTALIFVSCGFNKKQETNSNIGDFVDFINLGISVEEKKEPTFSLTGGFNLAAGSLSCDKIDYSWTDSLSGYNPTVTNQAITSVKFIDLDVFKLKVTKFYCIEGSDTTDIIEYSVDDPNSSYTDGETREYSATGRNNIEVTQTGDCETAGKGGRPQVESVDVAGCYSNSTISFSLTSFNLEDGSEAVAAASFQSEVGLSFSNGEPIPALTLDHLKYMNETYNPGNGRVDLAQVWECDIQDALVIAQSPTAECSGQLMSNLHIVLIDDSSKGLGENGSPQDALLESNDIDASDNEATAATSAANREAELIAAIEYEHELVANNITKNLNQASEVIIHNGSSGYKGAVLSNNRHGLEGQSSSNEAFYSNKRKYACIYSVGQNDTNPGALDWSKLGAKCKEIVFDNFDTANAFSE